MENSSDDPNGNLSLALDACAEEPIRIPGLIQPAGYLFVLAESGEILQVSENAVELFGAAPDRLVGSRITEWLGSYESSWNLKRALARLTDEREAVIELQLPYGDEKHWFFAIAHATDAGTIVEFEPVAPGDELLPTDTAPLLRSAMAYLEESESLTHLTELAAREVRRLTGFDRVMIYRFDDDWHGEVIAEDRAEHVTSYLHHHFPASDIPAQARALYATNPLRTIPDVDYRPVAIYPPEHPVSGRPLDMSSCVLRSVSPVHIQYLKNMNVGASMSISLLRRTRLWGLIACHHNAAHHVPFHVRAACQLIGQVVSLLLGEKEDLERQAQVLQSRSALAGMLRAMLRADDMVHGLIENERALLSAMRATGVVVVRGEDQHAVGEVPADDALRRLVQWVRHQGDDEIIATASLSTLHAEASDYTEIASGLFSLPMRLPELTYVIWLRPEVPQTVRWAGNPEKSVTVDADPAHTLHPRQSFESWEEEVRGRAVPWTAAEREAADRLRILVAEVVA